MRADRTSAMEALLAQAAAAHAVFEREELDGVYDEAWPRWYAAWAFDHGIAQHLAQGTTVDDLADTFATSWEEIQRTDPERVEGWPSHMAKRLAAEG